MLNSLSIGLAAGIICALLATAIALSVDRRRRAGRGGAAMEMLTMVPLTVPRLIFSVALLFLILTLPLHLYGTRLSILAAYCVVFLPVAYRAMMGVVSQIDSSLLEASRTLGGSPTRTVRSITMPLLRNGLVASVVLLFMLSLNEVGTAILLSGPGSQMLGPTLFNFYDSGGISLVSALAMTQVVIVLLAIGIMRRLSGRWIEI
jgi:ABC-type Fe3+ transport system permease subunit